MSLLRANKQGELVQVLASETEVRRYSAPEDMVYELELDQEANADLLAQITRDIDAFQLTADGLVYQGEAVVIQPTSAEKQRLRQLREQNANPLDLSGYDREEALLRTLANKVAWLEAEIRQLKITL